MHIYTSFKIRKKIKDSTEINSTEQKNIIFLHLLFVKLFVKFSSVYGTIVLIVYFLRNFFYYLIKFQNKRWPSLMAGNI